MRKSYLKAGVILVASLFGAATVSANDTAANERAKKFSVGLKYGSLPISLSEFEDSTGMGLHISFKSAGSSYVEIDYLTATFDVSGASVLEPMDFQTLAVYSVWRSSSTLYGLFKIGYLLEVVSNDDIALAGSGLSLGLGGGYRLNQRFSIEAGYSVLEQDVAFFGVTTRVSF